MENTGWLKCSGIRISYLDEVTAALKARVEQAGASYFRITSLDGKNKFYGTAVIYR
ncbi:DUF1471 domain-containing protein [Klebsiella pneumoniae]